MPAKKGQNSIASAIDAEISRLQNQIKALEKIKAESAKLMGGTVVAAVAAVAPAAAPAAPAKGKRGRKKGRKMSAEARARLAEVARARWAAAKQAGAGTLKAAAKKKTAKKKAK